MYRSPRSLLQSSDDIMSQGTKAEFSLAEGTRFLPCGVLRASMLVHCFIMHPSMERYCEAVFPGASILSLA